MDLEKGDPRPPSSDSGGGNTSLADECRHTRCTCGSGGVNSCYLHYSFGLRNTSLSGMFLVTLLFVVLAAVLLPRRIHPAADTDQQQQTVSVVWTVSLLVCAYLAFWAYTFSRTGAAAVFLRTSYAAALAYAVGALAGPVAGMAAAHLATAWAAGLLGYALAENRAHVGVERAADEAAARTPTPVGLSKGHKLTAIHAIFTVALLTLCLAALAVWLVFFSNHGGGDTKLVVVGLCVLSWMALYFWAFVAAGYLLREALVSMDSMMRFFLYSMAFSALSTLGLVVSKWIWVYGLAVEMMAMAAFFGYMLAVNARCKEILAREGRKQPGLADLFGDHNLKKDLFGDDDCDEATLETDVGGGGGGGGGHMRSQLHHQPERMV